MIYVDLKELRAQNGGLKQSELADILGCEQSYISQVESGKRNASDGMLDKLKATFGDITAYITESEDAPQTARKVETSKLSKEDFAAQVIRLTSTIDAMEKEIIWLRSMIEKLTVK